jgi:hypothetical protein
MNVAFLIVYFLSLLFDKICAIQDGFGDFQEVAPNKIPNADAKQPDALSTGLVDLGGLSLNEANKDPKSSGGSKSNLKQHDSFRGLDGFNTTPMPMPPHTSGLPLGVVPPQGASSLNLRTMIQPRSMGLGQSSQQQPIFMTQQAGQCYRGGTMGQPMGQFFQGQQAAQPPNSAPPMQQQWR